MRLLKWMMIIALMATLAACGEQQGAEDTAEDVQDKTEAAYDEAKEESEEAVDDAQDSDAWEKTKEGAANAWAATKEYSIEAWNEVRESFRGDMTAEEKRQFDECVVRLQHVEDLTEEQAERGCWRMMEEGTREDYYAEKGDSDFWADVKESAGDAWDQTKEGSKEAWDKTKEGSKKAWDATKEYSQEAWNEVRESFKGDMTDQEKQTFDDCVARLQREEGLTEEQAERGCWRMMEEDRESAGGDNG